MKTEYQKINSIFKRRIVAEEGHKKGSFIIGDWATPAFQYLQYNTWIFEEKVDGANIRVHINKEKGIYFRGKTDDAQLSMQLVETLQDLFTLGSCAHLLSILELGGDEFILYGEGYGKKIQSGGDYLSDRCSFILFDVKIGPWWLDRDNVQDVADKLGILMVPRIGAGTLHDAIQLCQDGFPSVLRKTPPEGLVIRPAEDLWDRKGERVITKLKLKDFK